MNKISKCCHMTCELDATTWIQEPDNYENYTEMCDIHTPEYLTEVSQLYPINSDIIIGE